MFMTILCLDVVPTADPFVAAENFLSANDLPAHYLDEVAEFIIKKAGDYRGPASEMAADPFTGKSTPSVFETTVELEYVNLLHSYIVVVESELVCRYTCKST